MTLETNMTERDKKLLVILVVIVIIVGFVFLGIRPLIVNYKTLKTELAQEEQVQEINKNKNMLYNKLDEYRLTLAANRKAATKDFYGVLKSDEIDKMLTNLALNYHLSARDLNIQMPEGELESVPYQYSDAALADELETATDNSIVKNTYSVQLTDQGTTTTTDASGDGSADAKTTDAASADATGSLTGVYAATVSMKVDGDPQAMREMIDDLALNYPSIRITGYSWDNDSKVSVNGEDDIVINSYRVLTLNLEIYMCAATAESE